MSEAVSNAIVENKRRQITANANDVDKKYPIVIEAERASTFIPGKDAKWQQIEGLGYNGAAVGIFPVTIAVRSEPDKISAESPCLQYRMSFSTNGDWQITVRALPTFSVDTGKTAALCHRDR